MKRSLFHLLATICFLLAALAAPAQNRLKDKTEATTPASDDWVYLDGATNGVRKFDAEKYNRFTRTANRVPYFNGSAAESSADAFKFEVANNRLHIGTHAVEAGGNMYIKANDFYSADITLLVAGTDEVLTGTANFSLYEPDNALSLNVSSGGASTEAFTVDLTTGNWGFGGHVSFPKAISYSATDTITITTNAGVIDVTKPIGSATNGAATSLTLSADNTTANRYLTRDFINSDGSNARVFTVDTVTDFTVTVPASSSITVTMKSAGASGWLRVGGASNVVDLSATSGTPASTKLVETVNPTTGVSEKTTIAQIMAATSSRLGSHASPNTAAGSITWTSMMYEVYTNTTTTYTLPAAAGYDGRAVIFYVTGTNAVTIDPNASEVIVRSGTAQTGGVTLTLTGTAGNYVVLLCDGTRWITHGYIGTLAAGS